MLNKKTKTILFLDLISLLMSHLAANSRGFADFYSHNIYRYVSLTVSSITGLLPFSLTEVLLYALIIFFIWDFSKALRGSFKIIREHKNETSEGASEKKTLTLYNAFKPMALFAGNLFLIASILFTLYVFNCGINYRRTSFSQEAGIPAYVFSTSQDTANADLAELCEYLVENINLTEEKLLAGSQLSNAVSPVKLYNGAYIGETASSGRASAPYLWETGKLGEEAMESLGTRFSRLSGHYPFPKPLINSWILSVQQVTGVYSPFTIEANYNRDTPYYDIPFTVCHELSHLRGYMQEEEANFIAVLATIGSEDTYFNYSGYVSAWVYAGNALAKADKAKFSELYLSINPYTRQDMMYNNEFWDRYETKVSEVHEELNDAYLKYNGQSQGVQSYGHVVDLMLSYFEKNGSLK